MCHQPTFDGTFYFTRTMLFVRCIDCQNIAIQCTHPIIASGDDARRSIPIVQVHSTHHADCCSDCSSSSLCRGWRERKRWKNRNKSNGFVCTTTNALGLGWKIEVCVSSETLPQHDFRRAEVYIMFVFVSRRAGMRSNQSQCVVYTDAQSVPDEGSHLTCRNSAENLRPH